jgi:hypothetical protein
MYREAMKTLHAFFLSLTIAFAASPLAASAQDLTAQDRAAIRSVVAALEADVRAGDFTGTLDVIPPPLLAATLERFGVTEAELRQTIDAQMEDALQSVSFETFSMAIDEAILAKTPGVARRYMLIPTETVVAIKDVGGMRARNHTLALEDQGKWYLVRIEDQGAVEMLRSVYPDFATVDFPAGTMEAVD